jgi:hypothetical protein
MHRGSGHGKTEGKMTRRKAQRLRNQIHMSENG